MMELLSRWFIRDRDNVTDPRVRRAYGQLCGAVGIGLNLLLLKDRKSTMKDQQVQRTQNTQK